MDEMSLKDFFDLLGIPPGLTPDPKAVATSIRERLAALDRILALYGPDLSLEQVIQYIREDRDLGDSGAGDERRYEDDPVNLTVSGTRSMVHELLHRGGRQDPEVAMLRMLLDSMKPVPNLPLSVTAGTVFEEIEEDPSRHQEGDVHVLWDTETVSVKATTKDAAGVPVVELAFRFQREDEAEPAPPQPASGDPTETPPTTH